MDIEITTFWNVATLFNIFNGVAAIFGSGSWEGILRYMFLFALMIFIFAYMNKPGELITWFFQALIFVTLINMPIARVTITDRAGVEGPRTVDNVPFVMAVVGSATSRVSSWLTETYETAFGVPDDLGLEHGDLAFGHRILKNVNRAEIADTGLRADLMQFIKECTLYDIRDGYITTEQIVEEAGAMDTMLTAANTSPSRYVTYNNLTALPITDTCRNVAPILLDRVNAGLAAAQTYYGRSMFSRSTVDAAASTLYANAVSTSYDWLIGLAQDSSTAMKQGMFNTLWTEAGSELPALMGDDARVAQMQSLTSASQTSRQNMVSNSTLSLLGQETLPHMRNWIEAILYAVFPIIVLLLVVTPTSGATSLLGGYMMSLAWIGLWPVMMAVINHLSMLHLQTKLAAMKLATAGGVAFQLSDVFDATITDEQAMIGYMVVLVPFLSGAIIKMGQGGIMSIADRMLTGVTGSASSIAASISQGNLSLGNASMDTVSANNTSMNKYDANLAIAGGGTAVTDAGGNTMRVSANGTVMFDQATNNFRNTVQLGNNSSNDLSRTATLSDSLQRGVSNTGTTGDGVRLTTTDGTGLSNTANSGQTESKDYARTHSLARNATEQDSKLSGMERNAGLTDQVSSEVSASGGLGIGGGGGGLQSPGQSSKNLQSASREVTDDYGSVVTPNSPNATNSGKPSGGRSPGYAGVNVGSNTSATLHASTNRNLGSQEQNTYGTSAEDGMSNSHVRAGHIGNEQTETAHRDTDLSASQDLSNARSHYANHSSGQQIDERTSLTHQQSLNMTQDIMKDPQALNEVARSMGYRTAARMLYSGVDVQQAVYQYAQQQVALQQPTRSISGRTMPVSAATIAADAADAAKQTQVDTRGFADTHRPVGSLTRPADSVQAPPVDVKPLVEGKIRRTQTEVDDTKGRLNKLADGEDIQLNQMPSQSHTSTLQRATGESARASGHFVKNLAMDVKDAVDRPLKPDNEGR